MTLELHATPEEVMRGVESLQEFARAQQLPEPLVFAVALALEECGSNVVNHALKRDAHQTFRVAFDILDGSLFVEIRDRGPEFDPTRVADRPAAADEDVPGGWGIQLVRRHMDAVEYRREAGQNILRLTKRLPSKTGTP